MTTILRRFYLLLVLLALNTGQNTYAQMNLTFADTLQNALEQLASDYNMKGVSSAVVFPDGSTWSGISGHHGTDPLTTTMLYDIGSNTKSMISTTILLLEEAGELSIDDTLFEFIDPIPNVPYGITLEQLMNHTSGIANYTEHPDFFDAIFDDTDEIWPIDSLLSNFLLPPDFEAGTSWGYSNSNYLLLGQVIEAIEDLPLNTVLRNRLFEPHGLENSFLIVYDTYPLVKTGFWNGPSIYDDSDYTSFYSSAWAAGGVIETPDDFASWCYLLGRGDILTPSSMEKLTTGYDFGDSEYGLGVETTIYKERPYLLHGGTTFQNSEMYYSMNSDFSVVVMNLDAGFANQTRNLELALIDILEWAVQTFASTHENDRELIISAYPNPGQSTITISLPAQFNDQPIQFDVYNMMGQHIFQTATTTALLVLDKAQLGSGQFLVKISNEHAFLGHKTVFFH